MQMMKMRYKDFEFLVNPKDVKLSMSRSISHNIIPHSVEYSQDLGRSSSVVSGKGYFVGEDAMTKAFNLIRVYNKKGSDYLFLPSSIPIKAYFSRLDVSYSSGENRVEYSFEFVEECVDKKDECDYGYTFAADKENLFDISNRTGIKVEKLVDLNNYGDLFTVREGDKVWLM